MTASDLLAPGAISPTSAEPSFITKWCIAASLFLNTSVSPALAITGFGVNALFPLDPTMVTVMLLGVGAGVGLGVGVGEGAA